MPKKGFKWEYIVLSAVLTLSVLSLAYYSYDSVGVVRPLQQSLLSDPDVTKVDMTKSSGVLVIEVALAKVEDLSVTYGRLYAAITKRLQPGTFQVKVVDQRDQRLSDVYHSVHYYLEEAALRGNFGAMIDECSTVLSQAGIADYRITVDESRIYVQMALGEHYLYQVLERTSQQQGGATP